MSQGPDERLDRPARGQPAPETWVFASGARLIILILLLFYLLFTLWPGHLRLNPEEKHGVVKLIPGLWMPDVCVEACYLVLVAVAEALGSCIHCWRLHLWPSLAR
jgi:hypothetical protein